MSKNFSENVGGGAIKPPVVIPDNPQAAMTMAQQSPELAAEILKFYRKQNERLEVESEKEAIARQKVLENQLMVIEEAKKEAALRIAKQDGCTHKQEGGILGSGTNVRGQRSGSRYVVAHCQRCAKIWHEQPEGGYLDEQGKWLPGHLQPQPHHIGGWTS